MERAMIEQMDLERRQLRRTVDRLIGTLSRIHALKWPPDVVTQDGKTYRFTPNADVALGWLRGMRDAIDAIPTALEDAERAPAVPALNITLLCERCRKSEHPQLNYCPGCGAP